MRIGVGFDVHALEAGRPLMLGGVRIPFEKGGAGHSDADVLIHALIDALLGAAALGDIGGLFPDTDPRFKNIDSKVLLREVVLLLHSKGFRVHNVDATICLQRPKVSSFVPEMRKVLGEVMQLDSAMVSVKATTTEGLGFVGREEGVAAHAVALLIDSLPG